MAKDLRNNKHLIKSGYTLEQCKFENRKALTDAFSDTRYAPDPEWRDLCAYMANQGYIEDEGKAVPQSTVVSGRELNRAMSDKAAARKQQDAEIAREIFQQKFTKRNPETGGLLYEESPSYRREVENWLIENSEAIDAAAGSAIIDRSQAKYQPMRVTIGEGENSSLYNEIKQGIRDKEAAAEKERIAEQHARIDRGEDADMRAIDGKKV